MNTKIDRKISVIFATDVVDYSLHMEKDETGTVTSLRTYEKVLKESFRKHGGRLFNTGGDSFMAEFSSAVKAVECAIDFQNIVKEKNKNVIKPALSFRIGINAGDVILQKKNLLGEGVNVAARLEQLSQPGGITISKSIFDYIEGKIDLQIEDLGIQQVKKNKFHAFDILLDPRQKRVFRKTNLNLKLASLVGLILLLFGVAYYQITYNSETPELTITKSDRPSILVLPFKNLSASDNEFVASGITDTLISTLSNYEKLLVQSRNTSEFVSKNEFSDEEILQNYKTQYIISGSVQVAGDKTRINVQLNDLVKNDTLYSEKYDFELEDLFKIQDTLSEEILNKLSIKLIVGTLGQDYRKYFKSVESWRKSFKARSELIKGTPESIQKLGRIADELMRDEPDNPMSLVLKGWHLLYTVTNKEEAKKGYDLALKSIELGSDISETHVLTAFFEFGHADKLFDKKEDALALAEKRALIAGELNKSSPHNFASVGNILSGVGKYKKALPYYRKAITIAPHAESWIKTAFLNTLVILQKYDEATPLAIELASADQFTSNSRAAAFSMLAFISTKQGNKKKATQYIEKLQNLDLKNLQMSPLEIIMRSLYNIEDKRFKEDLKKTLSGLGLP